MRDICGMAAIFKCPYPDCPYSGKKKANLHLHIMNKHRKQNQTFLDEN